MRRQKFGARYEPLFHTNVLIYIIDWRKILGLQKNEESCVAQPHYQWWYVSCMSIGIPVWVNNFVMHFTPLNMMFLNNSNINYWCDRRCFATCTHLITKADSARKYKSYDPLLKWHMAFVLVANLKNTTKNERAWSKQAKWNLCPTATKTQKKNWREKQQPQIEEIEHKARVTNNRNLLCRLGRLEYFICAFRWWLLLWLCTPHNNSHTFLHKLILISINISHYCYCFGCLLFSLCYGCFCLGDV